MTDKQQSDKNALLMKESAKIALISQLLKAFDDKLEYNNNIADRKQEEEAEYIKNFKWTRGYKFILLCIISMIVVTVPIMFLTTFSGLPLYYGIVPIGLGFAYYYKRKFDKEQKPSLDKAHEQAVKKLQEEQEDNEFQLKEIVNAIKAVTSNVKTKESILLYAYLPLDFMFSALENNFVENIDKAVFFFDEHVDKVKSSSDEESIALYNDITKSIDEALPRFKELKQRGLFTKTNTNNNNTTETEKE